MFSRFKGGLVRFSRTPYPLSWHLVFLVLAAMLPLIIFSSDMVRKLANHQRLTSERLLINETEELAGSVEREIDSTIRTLQALAVSDQLSRGDLRSFHAEVQRIRPTQPTWAAINLHSDRRELILSSSSAFDARMQPLNFADSPSLIEVLSTRQPVVGSVVDRFIAFPLAPEMSFAVRVPVLVDQRVKYVLSAVIVVGALQNLVRVPHADEWTRLVIDPEGTLAARSLNPEKYVGTSASEELQNLIFSKESDLVQVKTLENKAAYVSFHRSPYSGWTAAIAVPVELLDTPIRNSTLLVTSVSLLLLFGFGGIAFRYSRHLARSIKSASEAADALARGEMPHVNPSRVSEVEHLRKSLRSAAELLQFRESQRSENLTNAETARIEAETANSAKSNFLANMSHEIRTPLGAIMGFAELMRDKNMSLEDREKYLATIQRNGELLTQVIGDILDLSKVESGVDFIEAVRCSLPSLLADIEALLIQEARKKNISLKLKSIGWIPQNIETDPTKLKQVLINILGNAIKFTREGTVSLTVSVEGREHGSQLSFTIEDTGCGIALEHRDKLFKPFSQADESTTRKYGGTGLGLLLSRKLAEALGGSVELIASSLGEGSRFRIQIFSSWTEGRVRLGGIEESHLSIPSPLPADSETTLRGVGILVVEDLSDNQMLIKQILNRAGAGVELADNGLEGLEKARSRSYDIVLMDLQMPVKSGFEAVSELRAQGYDGPILALTAAALQEERERALQSGFDDLITKPINKNILINKVREYVGDLNDRYLNEA